MLISGFDFSDIQYGVEEEELTIAEGDSYDLTITYTCFSLAAAMETLTTLLATTPTGGARHR